MTNLRWQLEVADLARRLGWTVLENSTERQRPEDPSFVAVKGGELLAVWLRSSAPRAQRRPMTDRFPGVQGHMWTPADMAEARMVLTMGGLSGVGGGSDAA
ncbi:hypothetical protein [Streptomyces brevispora]|uniref:hypothetical protein n=1 Tax=Streptomyces brevispora TaxID=887462 RepID=UPI0035D8AF9F